jgi:hypothetical protein
LYLKFEVVGKKKNKSGHSALDRSGENEVSEKTNPYVQPQRGTVSMTVSSLGTWWL